jgi:tryptophan synthase alpha chain
MGVTGARDTVGTTARTLVARVRAVSPESAVCVGLGVSNGRQAVEVAQFADGVIVGSALVRCLLDSPDAAGSRPNWPTGCGLQPTSRRPSVCGRR